MPRSANSAVAKALDVIEIVASAGRPQRLSEIAEAAGLHRATAHRVLADLVARGWILRAGDAYLPGAGILRLARTPVGASLAALARPVLEGLSARTALMVNLQVPQADTSLVLDAVRPPRLHMITDLVGEALPVHRFAGPLALVAALPEDARAPYLRVAEADGTPAAALADALAEAERTGFAVEHGREDRMVASLSRAVLDSEGRPVCALTLVGPDAEFTTEALPVLAAALREAAESLAAVISGAAP
ncbi:IclR family transcriptional regulator [Actinocorallia herbida]|uniref:IclR family transcriptional regulator n=1 Tax=Actinocorallia herbida TaxID=58109 RepID=A0A3N1D6K3_9ACTN|nr:helix-turn-helix domain-containing protein [Actinocorallia herbida]ROO89096.1 IclR family transcriptional regulator [Actinocorallia herbida]